MQRVLHRLRPYSADDIRAIAELLGVSCAWPPPLPPMPQELLARWRHWDISPERDVNVLPGPDGAIIAFSQSAPSRRDARRLSFELAVHPDYQGQGIGAALFELAEARARELAATHMTSPVYMPTGDSKSATIRFLTARDFRCTSSYWRLAFDRLARVEPPVWPSGIGCRVFRNTREDAAIWARLINVAFEEAASAEMVLAQVSEPESSPDGYFFAVDLATGTEVGTSRARHDSLGGAPTGYLGTVGVLPAFRGRGIAEALIRQTLRYMAGKGMDNATLFVEDGNKPARTLYEKLGWRPLYRTDHYWKTLSPEERG